MAEDDFHVVDDEPAESQEGDAAGTPPAHAAELDGLRIRQLAAERRAIYRQRSYCVIFAAFCAVAAAQLIWSAVRETRVAGWSGKAMMFAGGALFAAIGAAYIACQALKLHRQAKRPAITDPAESPDFSTLSDGSQRWKNLHDM